MYILIQYENEVEKYIVRHDVITNFDPKDIDDFDRRKFYEAYWEGDDVTEPGFYKARILHMTGEEYWYNISLYYCVIVILSKHYRDWRRNAFVAQGSMQGTLQDPCTTGRE